MKKAGHLYVKDAQPSTILIPTALALPYQEHLGAARGTYTLGRWLTVLHGYALGVPHFPFGSTLDAVGLHSLPPF